MELLAIGLPGQWPMYIDMSVTGRLLAARLMCQATYNDDFVFVSMGLFCGGADDPEDFLSVLFAYSKATLYALPPSSPTTAADIKAAVYLGPSTWYRSVPLEQQSIGASGGYTPFNNFIQPARPQDPEDMSAPPLFVMKVRCQLNAQAISMCCCAYSPSMFE